MTVQHPGCLLCMALAAQEELQGLLKALDAEKAAHKAACDALEERDVEIRALTGERDALLLQVEQLAEDLEATNERAREWFHAASVAASERDTAKAALSAKDRS